MTIWAVVPAAGSGTRVGAATPKQYLEIAGRPLLAWSVDALLASDRVEACVVALAPGDIGAAALSLFDHPRIRRCEGGATRAASVAAGIAALDARDDDWVLVHDAARPCLPLSALDTLIDTVLASGVGALLAQPQSDTLKRADARGRVVETLARDGLWRAQTPQMFAVGALRGALASAAAAGAEVTDEASAMERAGFPVQVVEGPSCNLKVTYADDIELANHWLQAQQSAAHTVEVEL